MILLTVPYVKQPLIVCTAVSELQALPVPNRVDKVKSAKLCFNCLSRDHMVSHCSSKSRCRRCKLKHHTLLHREPSSTEADFEYSPPVRWLQ